MIYELHGRLHAEKQCMIARGQIWLSKRGGNQVEIYCKVGGFRWKVKKLTDKVGVYNGTHTLTLRTLERGFVRLL